MRVLKKVLVIIVIIIAVPLIVAVFVRKDFIVERYIIINKPRTEVFEYVRYFKNHEKFSVRNHLDPAMKKDFRGTDGSVGAVSMWDSETVEIGKGEQEIATIKDGERIDYKLRSVKPIEEENDSYLTTETLTPGQTKVKWGLKGIKPYPFNIMLLFMDMEKSLGHNLDIGLFNLKAELEAR